MKGFLRRRSPLAAWHIHPGGIYDVNWRYFRGLDHLLYISGSGRETNGFLLLPDGIEDCEESIRAYFEREKKRHPKCRIPLVTAIPFEGEENDDRRLMMSETPDEGTPIDRPSPNGIGW